MVNRGGSEPPGDRGEGLAASRRFTRGTTAEGLLLPLDDDRCGALAEHPRPAAPRPRLAAERPFSAAPRELEALYRRHHRLVLRLALRYGRGNTAWAEDVTQDVFLDLMKALDTLGDRESLEGWLYRATTNRCLNRLRRERFLALLPLGWLLGEPSSPDSVTIARDDLRRAFDALGKLPPREQVAFSMYYLDGKEQEEIGHILGHSKSYVCKLIQRAVAELRDAGWEVNHDAKP